MHIKFGLLTYAINYSLSVVRVVGSDVVIYFYGIGISPILAIHKFEIRGRVGMKMIFTLLSDASRSVSRFAKSLRRLRMDVTHFCLNI